MTTIKLTIEYDGTNFAGWQRQPHHPTIQQEIENALTQITQRHIPIVGAGRTDSGVHALGQVGSFRSDKDLADPQWTLALNYYLPSEISILSSESVPDTFHARYSAKEKIYEYRVWLHSSRPALQHNRVWHVPQPLDFEAMRQAFPALLGTHDFTSFQGPRSEVTNTICTISDIDLQVDFPMVRLRFQADRFLKQMIRALMGTLVEIGRRQRHPQSLTSILKAKDRRAAGQTAPPQGLYLIQVQY